MHKKFSENRTAIPFITYFKANEKDIMIYFRQCGVLISDFLNYSP
jgi:hypothetical protein